MHVDLLAGGRDCATTSVRHGGKHKRPQPSPLFTTPFQPGYLLLAVSRWHQSREGRRAFPANGQVETSLGTRLGWSNPVEDPVD